MMASDTALRQAQRSQNFSLDYFSGQPLWYGPYLDDGPNHLMASSETVGLPRDQDYVMAGWVFDGAGMLAAEVELVARWPGDRPFAFNLREAFADCGVRRGTLALLRRPADRNATVRHAPQTWTMRILNGTAVTEVMATGSVPGLNFPESTGRRPTFHLCSSALTVGGNWRSIATIHNASANPAYDTTVRLKVSAFNEKGDRLTVEGLSVPPFGSLWLDVPEVFGTDLEQLLAASGGRGAYTVESQEGGCIAYHFMHDPQTGRWAGDHTRPTAYYLDRGYGAREATLNRPTLRTYLSQLKFRGLQAFR